MSHKKLTNNPKFTTRRGNIFYVNFRLPSGAIFRQSLGTDSFKVAEVTMTRLTPFIPLVQNGTMSEQAFKLEIFGVRRASKADIDGFLLQWLQMGAQEAKVIPQIGSLNKKIFPGSKVDPEFSVEQAKQYRKFAQEQLFNGDDEFLAMMRLALKAKSIEVAKDDPEADLAAHEITLSRVMLYQAYEAFYSGDMLKYQELTRSLNENAEKLTQPKVSPLSVEVVKPKVDKASSHLVKPKVGRKKGSKTKVLEGSNALTVKSAVELYVKEKCLGWRREIHRAYERYFEVLIAILGDVPVEDVTKSDMRGVWAKVRDMPKRTTSPYKEMTLKQILSVDDVAEQDMMSPANAGKHWKAYRSLFTVFLKDEKDILTISPTEGIKVDTTERRYGNYTRPEMKKLISYALSLPQDNQYRWVLLLLCMTGARRGEVAKLTIGDLKVDEETGRYYLMIASEGGKTDAAIRQVPISLKLIDWGFLDYSKSKSGALFPDFIRNVEAITHFFRTVRDKLDIPYISEYGDKRVVHSCRHSTITELMSASVNPVLVQQIVGHEHSQSLGITARYTHRIPLRDLLPVIDSLDWGV